MERTGIVRDVRYLDHQANTYHPESHRRLEVIHQMLQEPGMKGKFVEIQPRLAAREELELIHMPRYVQFVAATADQEYALLDPDTGKLIPARGEVRPLVQQTFRPLQTASPAFDYWAAIPKDKGTVVGIYNTRNFNIKPVLTLPNITFDSMDIWVDAAEGKVYFVYEGHLLAAPIKVGR